MLALLPVPNPGPIVLYDGLCGFCDASVQWTLAHDPAGVFRFAPLQGETARAILARHPELPPKLDSIILVDDAPDGEVLSWHSRAIFTIVGRLPSPWCWLAVFRFLPRMLTDLGYRAFARARKWVWRRSSCRVPTSSEKARFLV